MTLSKTISALGILSAVLGAGIFAQHALAVEQAIDQAVGTLSERTYALDVLTPNGGEVFNVGDEIEISWKAGGTGEALYVRLAYSTDGGVTYETFETREDNDGSYMWIAPDVESDAVRVRVTSTDSVVALASDASDTDFTITTPEEVDDGTVKSGDIVRTQESSTLYYVTEDMQRRPFLSFAIYRTWFKNFSNVKFIGSGELALLDPGLPMLPNPGTALVKLENDPKVYVVEAHDTDPDRAVKRWIPSETLAQELFGANWADYIIDIPDSLYHQFDEGRTMKSDDYIMKDLLVKRPGA